MNLKPVLDKLILASVIREKTKGGILLPESSQKKYGRGLVVSVGPGRPTKDTEADLIPTLIPMRYKTGDVVVYGGYSGVEIEDNDTLYRIIPQDDVVALDDVPEHATN